MTLLLVFTDAGLPLPAALAVGAITALVFGSLFAFLFRRSLTRLITRLYDGEPALVPPPPAGEFTVRALGSLMTSPKFAVGGHLYAGPEQLAFVPHTKNRASDQSPRVVPWVQVRGLEPFMRPAPAAVRLFSPAPLAYLRVLVADGEWLLRVPEPTKVAAALERLRASSLGAV
jgi:hypothetical protein